MRRGHARRGPAMRRALQLLALLVCLSCGNGDDSPSVPSAGSPTSSSPAAGGASSTVAPLTTKPSVAAPGSSPSPPVTQTTQKAPSASPVAVKGIDVTTPKGTTAKPGTTAPASSEAVSKQTTAKPTSPLVIDKSTPQTGATTTVAKTSATSSSAGLHRVASGTPAAPIHPTTVAPGKGTTMSPPDAPENGTVTPPKPEEMSSPVSPTASKAPTTARGSTMSGNGTGVIIPGSEAPAKEKTTMESPGGAVVTPSSRPEQTSPKGSVLTTATQPGGTKGSTTTQSPPAVSTPQDSQRESLMTSRTTVVPPQTQGPFPAGGTNQTSFQAGTKIVCDDMRSSRYEGILLTLNESRLCNSLDSSPLKEPLMDVFCKAVKPSFDPNRDACTAKVAPVKDQPQKLAILGISMTTYFADDELSESLAVKKEELEKLGFSNFTYGDKPLDLNTKDRFGMPLIITIVCMAASLLLVAAIYGCCHQRISRRKDQQRLTEELQTMENGYHDNPTLEVMETSAEMQEKKINLNGELGDSWIVPMDSLMKEDLEEEEDTHL